ncbi:TPA: arsenic metallochaperone ArsD family protein [Pseudomonas aeruginosa]|nr:arsenic metallochaperone ArsD family protein [Pseudomonas aeruginosa]
MPNIEIFEPAGCCATSSAVIDQGSLQFNTDLDWLKKNGLIVKRHNLSRNPLAFMNSPTVKGFLDRSGIQSLPLTLVDGEVVLAGRLPQRDDLARWAGLSSAELAKPEASCCAAPKPARTSSCCGPASRS